MRSLKRERTAGVVMRGHALVQNIRRGRYELGIDARQHHRLRDAFTELVTAI
jgi:transposase, IS6 family